MTKKVTEIKNLTAAEALELVKINAASRKDRAAEALRSECRSAITEMIKAGEMSVDVELSDEDLIGLPVIIEELRELGYKYRLDSVLDKSAQPREQQKVSLSISIEHLV
jgi:hypothetical protein